MPTYCKKEPIPFSLFNFKCFFLYQLWTFLNFSILHSKNTNKKIKRLESLGISKLNISTLTLTLNYLRDITDPSLLNIFKRYLLPPPITHFILLSVVI